MSRLELAGWALFILSGIAFLAAGIRSGDGFVIVGSVFFVVGVVVVMKGAGSRP